MLAKVNIGLRAVQDLEALKDFAVFLVTVTGIEDPTKRTNTDATETPTIDPAAALTTKTQLLMSADHLTTNARRLTNANLTRSVDRLMRNEDRRMRNEDRRTSDERRPTRRAVHMIENVTHLTPGLEDRASVVGHQAVMTRGKGLGLHPVKRADLYHQEKVKRPVQSIL